MRNVQNMKICPILNAKLTSQSQEELPVIIQVRKDKYQKFQNLTSSLTDKFKSDLPLIGGFACNLTTDIIYKLANDPDIEYISFDSKVFALLDISTASIDAKFPHDRGYLGEGVTIAVIDTGVSPHKDLTIPNNRIVGFKDFINNKTSPYDDNGHGTHVAGIIAGNGYASRGRYTGVAPKSNILSVKALDENGSGSTSDIIKAISWIINTKDEYNTNILNLSLGSPANNPCASDPLCKAVLKAINSGLIVIVAAGNSGPDANTILTPGINPNVITVGAVDDKKTPDIRDDVVANFSSRGPTKEGVIKPDLVAPGVNIMSLSNKNPNDYKSLSGTSMATPLVSGSVALLLNKHGTLPQKEVKNKLLKSCIDLKEGKQEQGAGMISLEKLFYDSSNKKYEEKPINNIPDSFAASTNNLVEDILILLLILFLLCNN